MSPEEFNKLPQLIRDALRSETTPSALNTKAKLGRDPYTKTGVASLMGEAYDMNMPSDTQGTTYREAVDAPSSRSFITYSPKDPHPELTKAHEMEHALAAQGRGAGSKLNPMWDDMVGKEGAQRAEIVKRLVEHAPYLNKQWGLPSTHVEGGYFSPGVLKRPDARNFLYEQMATLSALEQGKNKRFVEDPYVRKNILRTPAERETYEALTGLRQTRMDARDLPPYTRQPGSTDLPEEKSKDESFTTKLRQLLGFANGGMVEKAGNKKTI